MNENERRSHSLSRKWDSIEQHLKQSFSMASQSRHCVCVFLGLDDAHYHASQCNNRYKKNEDCFESPSSLVRFAQQGAMHRLHVNAHSKLRNSVFRILSMNHVHALYHEKRTPPRWSHCETIFHARSYVQIFSVWWWNVCKHTANA